MKTRMLLAIALTFSGFPACTTTGGPDVSGMSFSSVPLVGKFVWHDLISEDIDAAQRFYGGLFGWTFEDTTGPAGRDYVLARSGDIIVAGLVPVSTPADGQNISRWLPYVSVDDVDQAVARNETSGGTIAVTARDLPIGRVAAIVDPQGAAIGLLRLSIGDPDDKTTAAAPGRVIWTELVTSDTAAATSFYTMVLGVAARAVERRGGEYIMLSGGGIDRAGITQTPVDDWAPDWLTYFGVNDPAAAAALARSLGGEVLLEPSPAIREGSMAIVKDPSGAVLVLQKWST